MCPICARAPAHSCTVFCDDHLKTWLGSPERYTVDWTSEDSYEAEQAQFVRRIQFDVVVKSNAKLILSAFQVPSDLLVAPTGSSGSPDNKPDSGH